MRRLKPTECHIYIDGQQQYLVLCYCRLFWISYCYPGICLPVMGALREMLLISHYYLINYESSRSHKIDGIKPGTNSEKINRGKQTEETNKKKVVSKGQRRQEGTQKRQKIKLKCGFVRRLKPKSVCMYVWSSHLAELLLLLLFLTFSVLVANPKKLLYTVADPDRGLLRNRENKKIKKIWQHKPPPPHPTHCSFGEKKIKNKKSRDASTGATQVSVGLASVQG